MKLIREVTDNPRIKHRYLLLANVTDDDATILELCNMIREKDFDEYSDEYGNAEAWRVY